MACLLPGLYPLALQEEMSLNPVMLLFCTHDRLVAVGGVQACSRSSTAWRRSPPASASCSAFRFTSIGEGKRFWESSALSECSAVKQGLASRALPYPVFRRTCCGSLGWERSWGIPAGSARVGCHSPGRALCPELTTSLLDSNCHSEASNSGS